MFFLLEILSHRGKHRHKHLKSFINAVFIAALCVGLHYSLLFMHVSSKLLTYFTQVKQQCYYKEENVQGAGLSYQ